MTDSPLDCFSSRRAWRSGVLTGLMSVLCTLLDTAPVSAQAILPSSYHTFTWKGPSGGACGWLNSGGTITAIARQADGGIVFAGAFDQVGTVTGSGLMRNSVARLKPDGSLDTDWSPALVYDEVADTAPIKALAVDSAGNVYVGGTFSTPGSNAHHNLARFSGQGNGELDDGWRADADGDVSALTVSSADELFVAGKFTHVGDTQRNYLAKIVSGSVDAQWNPAPPVSPLALALDDTSLYVGGGDYNLKSGASSTSALIAKYSRTGAGTADPNWNFDIPAGTVAALALDQSGNLYVGGNFTQVGQQQHRNIARVSTSGEGAVDASWGVDATTNGFYADKIGSEGSCFPIDVAAISVDDDDNVFVAGNITYPYRPDANNPSLSRNGLAKISASGQLDAQWGKLYAGSFQGFMNALTTADGKVYFGGNFGNQSATPINFGALSADPVNLNQHGLTGSWGRSDTPGTRQGFLFNFYPDNVAAGHGTVFAGWYTYDVAGGSGGQRWYALQGDVYSTDASTSLGIYTAIDGNLNSGSSPASSQVGTATLTFTDCSTGELIYLFNDGRSGIIPLSRVTHNTATCSASGDTGSDPQNYLLAGAWIVPSTSGMGFVIDVSPADKTLLGSWYTYFPEGYSAPSPRQQWFVFQDSDFQPTATASNDLDLLQGGGGTFDATVGGGVTTSAVGKVSLTFTSCTTATFTYAISTESVSQNTVNLTRLGPAPAGCHL